MGSTVSCPTISKEVAILEAKDLGIDWTEFETPRKNAQGTTFEATDTDPSL